MANTCYLILRAAERGLKPQPASPAVLQLSITPTTLHLPMNTRFSIGELNYYVSADRGSGKYEITCETAGEAGNDYTGTVIPIEYVDGLETCSISAVVIPGEDEEDTEVFRQRYMDKVIPLTKPFRFCKARFTLTETGKIKVNGSRDGVKRARRKLKLFHREFKEGKRSFFDIEQYMECQSAYYRNFNDHGRLLRLRRLYHAIFFGGGQCLESSKPGPVSA